MSASYQGSFGNHFIKSGTFPGADYKHVKEVLVAIFSTFNQFTGMIIFNY